MPQIPNPSAFRREQWKMLLITMFCYLFFYTGRHNFGWAADGMGRELNLTREMIGWISSAMLMGYALGQLINGGLADQYSPRTMITLGALLSVGANFLISFSGSFYVILILWGLNGYFQSLAWAPGSRLISNWWAKEERGKAFGFYTMAAGSSSVVTFLLSILLLQRGVSWHELFRIPVLLLLFATLIFWLLARSTPSEKGFADLYSEEKQDANRAGWMQRYAEVLKNRKFVTASVAIGFQSMARYGLIVWVPVHYLGGDWKSNPEYLWVAVLMPLGMSLGAVSFGALSDTFFKGNRPATIRMGMLASALITLSIYYIPAHSLAIEGVLMFLAGFFVYGPQANFWPMSSDLLGERLVGSGIGLMNMCAYLFAAMGEPLLGRVIDKTHDTASIFLVISAICILCACIISFVSYKNENQLKPIL